MLITFYDKPTVVSKIISTFVKIFLTDFGKMKNLGDRIRELREGREFDGTDYLLEAKRAEQVNREGLAAFCFKVDNKLKSTRGLLVTI
jgi:hypothetical protein